MILFLSDAKMPIFISVSSVILLLIGAIIAFIIRKKCASRPRTPQQRQALKKIGRPIRVQDFLQSSQNCVPTTDEFDELKRIDTRQNALSKSKETGLSMVRDRIPLNRYHKEYLYSPICLMVLQIH